LIALAVLSGEYMQRDSVLKQSPKGL
jgi:hypothetical protein